MKGIIVLTFTFTLTNVLGYHDPDLDYHLSQVQNVQGCDDRNGYSYAAPAVQLTTAGIKTQSILSAPAYQTAYSKGGYTSGLEYQAVAPKVTYASQPAVRYEAVVSHANYAPSPTYATQLQAQQHEVHGYATSAGLSSAASTGRTVIPQATYAQAPILAKITGAPLIAKFDTSPAKTTYVTQNLAAQQSYATGSLAKASLNSYNSVQHSGPVVTQLYSSPSASSYAASPALRVQQVQQQVYAPARYTDGGGPTQVYQHAAPISAVTSIAQVAPAYGGQAQAQYSSSVSHGYSANAAQAQYASQAVSHYSAPVASAHYTQYPAQVTSQQYVAPVRQQYAAPVVSHFSAPAVHAIRPAQVVSHYSAPAVAQYATSGVAAGTHFAAAAPVVSHVAAPVVSQAAPAVAHVAAPAVAHIAQGVAAPTVRVASGHAKNVHTEFLENYDAHPRYAFEYSVNDPHTGDIKQQKEERDGEVVKGQYSLVEPDGSVRTVNYVADWKTGFHADVRNSKDNQH